MKIILPLLLHFVSAQLVFAQSDMIYIQGVNYSAGSGETPGMMLLNGGGHIKLGFYMDEPAKYCFLIDAKNSPQEVVTVIKEKNINPSPNTIRVLVKPKTFKIIAGKDYSVNTSFYDPWIQKADKDGELIIELKEPGNCTVVIEDAQGGNLLQNHSFETASLNSFLPGWVIENSKGGKIVVDTVLARSGHHSIAFNKLSGDEAISFKQASPVAVSAGKSYLAAAYYHLQNARYGSVFNFVATISANGKPDINVEPLYTSENIIYPMPIDNPKEEWVRTFMNVNVPEDYEGASIRLKIIVRGVPYTVWFDDMELRVNPSRAAQFSSYLPAALNKPVYSKEEVHEIMGKRNAVKVELPFIGKTPLKIDNKPVPMIAFSSIFSPEWPYESAHKEYLRHGIPIHFIPVMAFSRNPQECTWIGEGKYDFRPLEAMLEKMLGFDPNAYIMLNLDPVPYPELGDKHPEARWVNAKGEYSVNEKEAWKPATERKPDEDWNLSYTAPIVRSEIAGYFKALAEFLKTSDVGKAVVGVHIGGGTDGQWFRRGWGNGFGDFDHSLGAEESFRQWLKIKYNNDNSALQKAWGDNAVQFENATLCSEKELASNKYFLKTSSPKDQRVIDNLFYNGEGANGLCESINLYCKTFKENIGRTALTFTYYPKKHNALAALIEQPWLDGILGVLEYGYLRNLGQSGGNESSPGSLKLHNKLFLTEMDYRTEYATSWGEDGNHHRRNVVIMRSPEELANQMRRDMGNSITQGQGGWFYGLCGHIWGTDEYYTVMDEAVKAAYIAMSEPVYEDHGQIAIFRDEKSRSFLGGNEKAMSSFLMGTYWSRVPFNRSGLPWDDYLLSDLENTNLPKYKIYVFLNAASLSPQQINFIKTNLQKDGNVLLFFNGTGYAVGNFEKNIQALTGFKVKADVKKEIQSGAGYALLPNSPLNGLENIYSYSPSPLFYVDDPTATPVAKISGTNKVGAAIKNNGDWTGVYLSLSGVISPQFIREIAKVAKVQPIGPQEDVTYSGNGFLLIHAMKGGKKILQWEGKSDLFDITTGTTIAKAVESITLEMKPFETRWFKRRLVK